MVGGTKNYFYIYIWGHGGAHKCVNLKDRRIDQKPITGRVSQAFCPTLSQYAANMQIFCHSLSGHVSSHFRNLLNDKKIFP